MVDQLAVSMAAEKAATKDLTKADVMVAKTVGHSAAMMVHSTAASTAAHLADRSAHQSVVWRAAMTADKKAHSSA